MATTSRQAPSRSSFDQFADALFLPSMMFVGLGFVIVMLQPPANKPAPLEPPAIHQQAPEKTVGRSELPNPPPEAGPNH